jgi:hypothetical protein
MSHPYVTEALATEQIATWRALAERDRLARSAHGPRSRTAELGRVVAVVFRGGRRALAWIDAGQLGPAYDERCPTGVCRTA